MSRLPGARFAYLSACATYQGAPTIPDEAVTVGTALCIADCQNVIAVLWPVADNYTPDFARQASNKADIERLDQMACHGV